MKTLLAAVVAATVLGGCAVEPYGPGVVVAAPAPTVVVRPQFGYYGGYRGEHHRGWGHRDRDRD